MTMSSHPNRSYRATAKGRLAGIDAYIESITDAFASHDMTVKETHGIYHLTSAFGHATFEPIEHGFHLTAEAQDPGSLNRLKHALVGPIGFIAARETLEISWEGDYAEPALPDDLRILTVRSIEDIAPRFRRIIFTGDNLERYDRPDQLHCRLIFQPRGITKLLWPMLDHRGHVIWPDNTAVPTRVYTIRHINAAERAITIDFALHDNPGPATRWAMDARIDDIVGILGPAAHAPKEAPFTVLIGDETALPGIARITEHLPAYAKGHVFIEVDSEADLLPLSCPIGVSLRWLFRKGVPAGHSRLLEDAIRTVQWPDDKGKISVWGGCEHKTFSALYRHLKTDVGLPRDHFVLHSHWHRDLSEDAIIAKGGEAYLPD